MEAPPVQYTTTSDGVSIAWAEAGQGPALLIFGSTPWTHVQEQVAVWGAVYEAFTRSFRLVTFDARGTGMSERDVAGVSAETLLLDAEAVIDAAKLDRFIALADCKSVGGLNVPSCRNGVSRASDTRRSRVSVSEHAGNGRYVHGQGWSGARRVGLDRVHPDTVPRPARVGRRVLRDSRVIRRSRWRLGGPARRYPVRPGVGERGYQRPPPSSAPADTRHEE